MIFNIRFRFEWVVFYLSSSKFCNRKLCLKRKSRNCSFFFSSQSSVGSSAPDNTNDLKLNKIKTRKSLTIWFLKDFPVVWERNTLLCIVFGPSCRELMINDRTEEEYFSMFKVYWLLWVILIVFLEFLICFQTLFKMHCSKHSNHLQNCGFLKNMLQHILYLSQICFEVELLIWHLA